MHTIRLQLAIHSPTVSKSVSQSDRPRLSFRPIDWLTGHSTVSNRLNEMKCSGSSAGGRAAVLAILASMCIHYAYYCLIVCSYILVHAICLCMLSSCNNELQWCSRIDHIRSQCYRWYTRMFRIHSLIVMYWELINNHFLFIRLNVHSYWNFPFSLKRWARARARRSAFVLSPK